jgi:alanine or glycine:cation symporter, AGCS family
MSTTTWLVDQLHRLIWGYPLLLLILGVALYLTFLLKGVQFCYLAHSLKQAFSFCKKNEGEGDISHFQSLMTSLAGTIGIGNIAGIATAIAIGGLGAIFWVWVMAMLGMATRYSESLLAVKYRKQEKNGTMSGGSMYFIDKGLGWKWLAGLFSVGGATAAICGGNMIQSNSIALAFFDLFEISPWVTGVLLTFLTASMLFGGIKRIASVASLLVPLMSILYLGGGICIICYFFSDVPQAFMHIITSAFTGQTAVGGFIGSSAWLAIQYGVARGISASEAGLGSGAIAAAAAKTDVPGRQAMVSMIGTFIAGFVVSTITGLVLALTSVIGEVNPQGVVLNGASMTIYAFNSILPGGKYIVILGVVLFGYTTIIGWAYYGEKCTEHLFGSKSIFLYRIIFCSAVCFGSAIELMIVWKLADIANALMIIPNTIALLALSKVILKEHKEYVQLIKKEKDEKSMSASLVN